jgi:ribosome modulation factor
MLSYQDGRAAFHRGISFENPPYDDAQRRIPWVKGWFDSRNDNIDALARLAANQPLCR